MDSAAKSKLVSGPLLSRRRLLGAGMAAPLAASAGVAAVHGQVPWEKGTAAAPRSAVEAAPSSAYVFFNAAEAAFVEAAVARLIPGDDLGPGALQAGVATFIDRQLAGDYGHGTRWYMLGPWGEGESTQGYQTRHTPASLYRSALREIDAAVARDHNGTVFAKLPGADQDALLHQLEDGSLSLPAVDAKTFFTLLLQNTKEGFWSDPIYGGNRDMAGWKLIGFAGARYDGRPFVKRHGEPYPLPPVGLKGRVEWFAAKG